jgi:hypothetical protein
MPRWIFELCLSILRGVATLVASDSVFLQARSAFMQTHTFRLAIFSLALALFWGASAGAQVAGCTTSFGFGGVGMIYALGRGSKNAPFSGTVKRSFEQKLVDGNAIHAVQLTHQARDSSGRTVTEMVSGCSMGSDGLMHERISVNVNDPVARVNMNWQVGDDQQRKVVQVFHQPEPSQRQRPQLSAEQLAQQQKAMEAARARGLQQQTEYKSEDLGVRDFHGVSAHGTRSTRTIPAAEEGNDQTLVVVTETWRSKELGLVMMEVEDDPRRGKTTAEYEELTLGEPDPGLFAAPAGYTVKEQPQVGLVGAVAAQ